MVTGTVEDASVDVTGGTITLAADSMAPGSSISVAVTTTLAGSLPAGGTIENTASFVASSLPGTNGTTTNNTGASTPGASGSTTGEAVYTGSESAEVTVAPLQPQKSVVSTTAAHTDGANIAIGEVVRYRVAVTIPEGVSADFALADTLPAFVALHDTGNAMVSFVGADLTLESDLEGTRRRSGDLSGLTAPTFTLPVGSCRSPVGVTTATRR